LVGWPLWQSPPLGKQDGKRMLQRTGNARPLHGFKGGERSVCVVGFNLFSDPFFFCYLLAAALFLRPVKKL
jgi:hypothetical protein